MALLLLSLVTSITLDCQTSSPAPRFIQLMCSSCGRHRGSIWQSSSFVQSHLPWLHTPREFHGRVGRHVLLYPHAHVVYRVPREDPVHRHVLRIDRTSKEGDETGQRQFALGFRGGAGDITVGSSRQFWPLSPAITILATPLGPVWLLQRRPTLFVR